MAKIRTFRDLIAWQLVKEVTDLLMEEDRVLQGLIRSLELK